MKEIRLYIEGGGDAQSKAALRKGFRQFFTNGLKENARKLHLTLCKSTVDACEDFAKALEDHPAAFNILLIDSDGPVVKNQPLQNFIKLQKHSKYNLDFIDENQIHLMVQLMEAWFVADLEALNTYYGQAFKASADLKRKNVEQIEKATLIRSLKTATRKTRKGEYHKIKHAADLLAKISPPKVRQAADYCERLFKTLEALTTEN